MQTYDERVWDKIKTIIMKNIAEINLESHARIIAQITYMYRMNFYFSFKDIITENIR